MSPTDDRLEPEALLAQQSFVRALVRSLLDRGDDVEDVVAETCVRAWHDRSRSPSNLRAWLARIARNLAMDRRRAVRRHERWHALARGDEVAPSASEVLIREEHRQRVVHAVLSLPQPYREVVLLRYWEGLPPAVIAQRLRIPSTTVRSQLARGLTLLRERLDRVYHDRRDWTAALAPIALVGSANSAIATAISTPVLAMQNSKLVLPFVALLILGPVAWWNFVATSPSEDGNAVFGTRSSTSTVTPTERTSDAPTGDPDEASPRTALPTGELAVRVMATQRGIPIEGCEFELHWFDGTEARGAPTEEAEIRTDGDGIAVWRGRRRDSLATVSVVARQPTMLVFCTPEVVLPAHTEVELEVSVVVFDRVVFGTVRDASGNPVAGARIAQNGWDDCMTLSDRDGHYELRVSSKSYPLLVSAAGFRDLLVAEFLPEGVVRHELPIELLEGITWRGRVVDERGEPIADATVSGSGAFRNATTDREGRFALSGMTPFEQQMVTARKAGFRRAETISKAADAELELVLHPGLAVTVEVRTTTGEPLPGAVIHWVENEWAPWARKGATDARGTLTLADLDVKPGTMIVEAAGFVSERLDVDPNATVGTIAVVLQRGHEIRGRVVDARGQPLSGIAVWCNRVVGKAGQRSVGTRTYSDRDGRFRLRGLPSEDLTVHAHPADHRPASTAIIGGATAEVNLVCEDAAEVTGRVLDAVSGEAIENFEVAVKKALGSEVDFGQSTPFSTADGRFRMRNWNWTPSEVEIRVTAKGRAPTIVRTQRGLNLPDDVCIVRLPLGSAITGVLRDAETAAPVVGAVVTLVEDRTIMMPTSSGPSTDAQGRFRLADLALGEHRLLIEHPEYPPRYFGPVRVESPGVEVAIAPTLHRGVAIRGRVLGAVDLRSLRILALLVARGATAEARIEPTGECEISGIPPGTLRLAISDREGRWRTRILEVGSTGVEGVRLDLTPGPARLRIAVRGPAGPVENGAVRLTSVATLERLESAIQDGVASIDGLPSGVVRIEVHAEPDLEPSTREIDLRAGFNELEIVLQRRS
jgi:RNA polymerase sigma-70 factor (ECF subfamily)